MYAVTVSDTTNPRVTASGPSGTQTGTDSVSATLSATTDERTLCKYSTQNTTYDNMTLYVGSSSVYGTTHTKSVSHTSDATITYYVVCRDVNGRNSTAARISYSVDVTAGVTPGGGSSGGGGHIILNQTQEEIPPPETPQEEPMIEPGMGQETLPPSAPESMTPPTHPQERAPGKESPQKLPPQTIREKISDAKTILATVLLFLLLLLVIGVYFYKRKHLVHVHEKGHPLHFQEHFNDNQGGQNHTQSHHHSEQHGEEQKERQI
ncbi:hypothetical protein COY95_04420 [Candidatus Woesearchaeota archaeon CG_4_10_14_0_8_um_filter_47_5]|nr:MAG: hypothetical protein COY95_04420 [Candidatus Woesearchaeota archaeon CG_4_10_14_0_8_um_filter_47_5]